MNVAPRPQLLGLALCAGVGMLDEGIAAGFDALGIDYRTVAYVERDAYAAAALVARMAGAALAPALVWDDLTTFPGRSLRGIVDCVSAGFPCQDLSVAGKRAGLDGKRSGLFFDVLRIADDCDARFLVLENVGGIATATADAMDEAEGEVLERAAARVLGELADRGWHAEWLTLRASDVGAAHGRERWFCFAWRVADAARIPSGQLPRWERVLGGCTPLANAEVIGRREGRPEHDGLERRHAATERSCFLADAECCRSENVAEISTQKRQSDPGRSSACVVDTDREGLARGGYSRDEAGRQEPDGHAGLAGGELFAPGPADERWPDILDRHPELAPALEPGVRRVVDGLAYRLDEHRADRLRCGGNGVVALQAAVAIVELVRRSGLMTQQPAAREAA